ncbi:hypothetical protein [Dokdonella sp.]|uniref:hypothetical protein n=1 Tax=Dokdonella sp. TaxID=2291710 RepID=UPI0025C61EBD|nr:hypothetical protein [Dokdonella sp.]MBX3692958.1 hypothetical protein [Dokdonella sp.]MCW5568213.1 hypothetical protein [Dokdonella sp.]
MNHEKKLSRSIRNNLGLMAGAALLLAATTGNAAIVCDTPPLGGALPYSIPDNIDGVYANLVTGAYNNGSVANWDINFYNNSAGLSFWTNPGTGPGTNQVVSSTPGTADVLAAGATIGPGQTYNTSNVTGGTVPDALLGGGSGYIGVRFYNEVTSAQNYGWVALTTTGPNGFPATITGFCYENTGAAITAGTTPVTLQGFSVD